MRTRTRARAEAGRQAGKLNRGERVVCVCVRVVGWVELSAWEMHRSPRGQDLNFDLAVQGVFFFQEQASCTSSSSLV